MSLTMHREFTFFVCFQWVMVSWEAIVYFISIPCILTEISIYILARRITYVHGVVNLAWAHNWCVLWMAVKVPWREPRLGSPVLTTPWMIFAVWNLAEPLNRDLCRPLVRTCGSLQYPLLVEVSGASTMAKRLEKDLELSEFPWFSNGWDYREGII